ncbi:hypothetical protein [Paenibacillus andongensis]|uniref:hypothetical protein n=1 Tax=Paenibacillus andongensis TaxID=2975482 RepID=UPI0021BB5FDC|nr:hypothetical protein [Paenibacillus andongensis]
MAHLLLPHKSFLSKENVGFDLLFSKPPIGLAAKIAATSYLQKMRFFYLPQGRLFLHFALLHCHSM